MSNAFLDRAQKEKTAPSSSFLETAVLPKETTKKPGESTSKFMKRAINTTMHNNNDEVLVTTIDRASDQGTPKRQAVVIDSVTQEKINAIVASTGYKQSTLLKEIIRTNIDALHDILVDPQ